MGALVRCEAHTEKCRIRQAIQQCWMLLAKEKRTPEELESQIRRIVDRALTTGWRSTMIAGSGSRSAANRE